MTPIIPPAIPAKISEEPIYIQGLRALRGSKTTALNEALDWIDTLKARALLGRYGEKHAEPGA
jgi:hypothetical protein